MATTQATTPNNLPEVSARAPMIAAGILGILALAYLVLGWNSHGQKMLEIRHAFLLADFYYQVAFLTYGVASILYFASIFSPGDKLYTLARLVMGVGLALNFMQVADRWVVSGRPPFKTLYEVTIYISLLTVMINVALEFMKKARLLSFLVSLLALGCGFYAFSKVDSEIIKLPPALQHYVFIPHVTVYIAAYSAMAIGFLTAVLYLFWPRKLHITGQDMRSRILRNSLGGEEVDYEQFTYSILKLAFVFLTIGLLLGSVWGKIAWADWWFWDPKENWALITWMIYLGYLHMRRDARYRGKKAIIYSMVGFAAVVFTYIGMKYLPVAEQSEHVYTD